jgi:hypothetical protein
LGTAAELQAKQFGAEGPEAPAKAGSPGPTQVGMLDIVDGRSPGGQLDGANFDKA